MPVYALDGISPDLPEDDSHWIAPGAHVMGRIVLGRDVGIWFGSVLRGDNETITIGAGSNIQEGCTLHTDMGFPMTIGPNVTVGHNAILHGCTIGEQALVGMGATILNGAVIGAGSLVGAGALVTEGKTFPERSLIVGSPARVVRTLDDAAVAGLRATAENYVRNQRRYKAGLVEL